MPDTYRGGERIPELKGRVRGGIAVLVHSPTELSGLQRLIAEVDTLPGDPLDTAYHIVANAGSTLGTWVAINASTNRGAGDETAVAGPSGEEQRDPKAQALVAALGLARTVWEKQAEPDELACAMLLPRPGRRCRLETSRPSLTLDYGSIRARALSAGAKLRGFGVALFPVARSRRQLDLVGAMRASAPGMRLPHLESLQPADLEHKSAVIVFLHGLMSIDVGTFDEFIKALQTQDPKRAFLLAAWPHDTLGEITLNADELAEHLQQRIWDSQLPIAFVCHSRGGLVARRAIVELIRSKPMWRFRLRACVTFGTPHEGAGLAEKADELLGKWLLQQTVYQRAGSVPLVDALWTAREFEALPGITDLRPRMNGGTFLRHLAKDERQLSEGAGLTPVPIFAVGGNTRGAGMTGWLTRRFFRGEPNDLIVELSSSASPRLREQAETTCDHFNYFSVDEARKPHFAEALRFLRDQLAPQLGTGTPRPKPARPKAKRISHRTAAAARTASTPATRRARARSRAARDRGPRAVLV